MIKKLLKNNIASIYLKNKVLYLKIKNLENIKEEDFEKITFIYRYFNLICFDKKLNFRLVIDFLETNINIMEFIGYINSFVNTLSYTKPITNITLDFTVILLNNEIIKNVINMVLNMYNSGRPVLIVSNEDDITKLLSS